MDDQEACDRLGAHLDALGWRCAQRLTGDPDHVVLEGERAGRRTVYVLKTTDPGRVDVDSADSIRKRVKAACSLHGADGVTVLLPETTIDDEARSGLREVDIEVWRIGVDGTVATV